MPPELAAFVATAFPATIASAIAVPRQLRALRKSGASLPLSSAPAVAQSLTLAVIGAALGAILQGRTGFELHDVPGSVWGAFLVAGMGLLGHLVLYYGIFRPRLLPGAARRGEAIRVAIGLPVRLLQGGLVEEVQYRWGLMSVFAALASQLGFRASVPFAIAASAVVFSAVHLAGARQIHMGRDGSEALMILVLNTWGGVVFGWLFWQHGLVWAVGAHAGFHAVWHPMERATSGAGSGVPGSPARR